MGTEIGKTCRDDSETSQHRNGSERATGAHFQCFGFVGVFLFWFWFWLGFFLRGVCIFLSFFFFLSFIYLFILVCVVGVF